MSLFLASKAKTKIPGILLGIFALSLIFLSVHKQPLQSSAQKLYLRPPQAMIHFTFGYREVMADSLWIRAIQDFDFCDRPLAQSSADLVQCEAKSWLYQVLDVASDLSPHFRILYSSGALALSVIISDVEGARLLFDKGVKNFPQDWVISYRAAYHYLYDVKEREKAAELLLNAARFGAPSWVYNLAGRIYSDEGHKELAETVLAEMRQTAQDPLLIQRLEAKLKAIKN